MTKEHEKHKEAFLNEARTLIEEMNASLLKLEKSPNNLSYLHGIFRAVHTLKSMAAAIDFHQTAKLCHGMEDCLEELKKESIDLKICVDPLFTCFDFLSKTLKCIDKKNEELNSEEYLKKINILLKNKSKLKSNHWNEKDSDISLVSIEKVQSIEVKVEKLDCLLNLVEELLVSKMKLDVLRELLKNPDLSATTESLGRIIGELQYNVMQVRMVSLAFIFNQFPRMVRDLAKQQNKKVELIIEGGSIELDRSVTDEISESIVHLIRNAIDHGIESPAVREKSNKPETAEIRINASRTKESVIIEVSDDGAGLNVEEIRKIAENQGLLKGNETEEEIINTIFSEVSTAKKVTDISGRGLGLNIVKQKIESLNGTIRVKSSPQKGTTFYIDIPLSLAVLKALFVKVMNKIYAIPVMNIERIVTIPQQDLKHMLNNESMILYGQNVPIARLDQLFGGIRKLLDKQPIVVIQKGDRKLGVTVDELLTTEEIVIKPLNRIVKENKYFSGSAIIGTGEIVLILDVIHLLSYKEYLPKPKLSEKTV